MKVCNSKAYLVIGTAHLGLDSTILQVFAQVAKQYSAEVVHLGRITPKEAVKQARALCHKTDKKSRLEYRMLCEDEQKTLKELKDAFGKVTLVLNGHHTISEVKDPDFKVVSNRLNLCKHLSLDSVPPTGDKVATLMPITDRAKNSLKTRGASWILPHPTSAVESDPREGLNQAYNYYTTGSLTIPADPEIESELYKSLNLPCSVLVLVDQETGEFHAHQLHVDYVRNDESHRIEAVVLDDGLVFTRQRVFAVDSSDKAAAVTDEHDPYTHMGVLASVRAQNVLHAPAVFINGGDASDMEPVSRHTKDKPKARENLRLRTAIRGLRWLLDAQTNVQSIVKKVLLDSNHHDWLTLAIDENPWLDGLLDWSTLAKTTFSDWDVYLRTGGPDKTFKFGDLSFRHGDKESIEQAWKIFGKYLGGHFHKYKIVGRAVSAGPGCRLGPKYLQNATTSWQNTISSITRYKGKAAVAPKIVLHNEEKEKSRFCYGGKIYEVDFYKKS